MTTQNQQFNPFNPPEPQTPNVTPGYKDIQMPAVHPDIAKQILGSKVLPTVWQPPAVLNLARNTVQGAPSILEMARALKNDPQLMYQFVYDNIEHQIGMGLAKGPLATLLDSIGNSFDLSSLLAALLRQAGFQAYYQVGQIQLTFAQVAAWLGITDTDITTAVTLIANAGVPVSLVGTAPNQEILMTHCWLKVNIGTVATPNWVVMDPSFKTYTTKPSIDLAAAMGYDAATFLSDARVGYTIDSSGNWVQNLNRTNVRNSLTTLSMNLANWIRTNNPGAETDDIVGGRQIVPVALPITFATSLPYQAAGDTPVEFTDDFSTAYKVSVRLIYSGFDVTLTSDQLSGHRLTLFFEPNASGWAPTLALDGVIVAAGTTVGGGFSYNLQVIITHNAYPNTNSDQGFYLFTEGPIIPNSVDYTVSYLLGSSFGANGKGLFDYHTVLQYQNEFDAGGAGPLVVAEPVLGERMAAQWASFASQQTMVTDFINRMTGTNYTNHHLVGLVTYRVTPNDIVFSGFDLQGSVGSLSHFDGDNSDTAAAGILRGMHQYALEMLAIQQQTTAGQFANQAKAVSTTRLIDVASDAGAKLFKGTAANWNSDVAPQLTNYGAGNLNSLYNTYLLNGFNVLLPQNYGTRFNGVWTLRGWSIIDPTGNAGGTIFGAYGGGLGYGWWRAQPPKKCKKCKDSDVDVQCGDFDLQPESDIHLGSGDFPHSLNFERSYNSSSKLENGPLGLGWTHNFAMRAKLSLNGTPLSDGYLGLGSESPICAVASITQLFVTLDVLKDNALPVDKLVIAHLCDQWWVDNLTQNIVTVEMPGAEDLVFTKLPDGSFQSPGGNASTLSGSFMYTMTTPQKVVYNFGPSTGDNIGSIVYPSGASVTMTYLDGKLQTVENSTGRVLTFSYTGNFISSVSDGRGRSVSYSMDGANQLIGFTDALAQAHSYEYDFPGRMSKYFKPGNPTIPCVTNTFDSLNRVQSQVNILGQTKTFYFSGPRSEVVDSVGNSTVRYFDASGNEVRKIDALGNVFSSEFDGLGRLVKEVMPEGNFTIRQFDLNNNVLTETMVPKPGSALANIVRTNTFDPLWNRVSMAIDGRGNATNFTYDPVTGNLLTIQRPAVGGLIPTISMTWNSRGQMLTKTDETGVVTSMVYSATRENLLSVVADFGPSPHLNLTTNFVYDSVGNRTSVQDPLGRTTKFLFDALRRMTRRTETAPFNHQTRFAYDENSNLLSVRRQTGIVATPWQIYTFAYSLSDKKIRVIDPAGKITRWFYDGADRLRRVRDAGNREYVYGYDQLNRPRTVIDPAGVVSETLLYSDNGKVRSVKDARGFVKTFSFDGFDRLNRTNYPDGTFERNQVYDQNGFY
jgi:YD repeat-containing protein